MENDPKRKPVTKKYIAAWESLYFTKSEPPHIRAGAPLNRKPPTLRKTGPKPAQSYYHKSGVAAQKPVLSEQTEQINLVRWCDKHDIPIQHSPNGARRSTVMGRLLLLLGLRPGWPDLFVPLMRQGFGGLFIELKRRKGGVTTLKQREWLQKLSDEGYKAVLCIGADEAQKVIEFYLGVTYGDSVDSWGNAGNKPNGNNGM